MKPPMCRACSTPLGSVQMVDGMAKMGDGQFERTLFTSGYSSKTNTYYMNTYDDPAIRSYAMADYEFFFLLKKDSFFRLCFHSPC